MNWSPDDVQSLLKEYGAKLFALLVRLTLRVDVAEDLLQELFCKLAQSEGFRRAENRAGYAYRTATNLAFDWRRRNRRMPLAISGEPPDSASAPLLADLIEREELERTLNAMGELSDSGREIVVRRYLDGDSYESIGKQFGKTTHQVRALCHKALVQLRRRLGASEPMPTERGGR